MATDSPSASSTNLRREHALHNEKVCHHLAESNEYNDWVVTTAFYSALHWIEHHLFPYTLEEDGAMQKFDDINEYSLWLTQEYGIRSGKHMLRLEMVRERCPAIRATYESLYDNCMSARYRDYRVSQKLVAKALKCLSEIHAFCDQKWV
jgi:hypothetical protein